MENEVTASATDNAMSRRSLLMAFGASAAICAAPAPNAEAVELSPLDPDSKSENPALAVAYAKLIKAQAEHAEATDALEWLADEWKHRWPLAPVQILGCANADRYGRDNKAERDIIGRYIYRDPAELRGRFSATFASQNQRVCFSVETAADLTEMAEYWEGAKIRGKSDNSRANSARANAKRAAYYRAAIPMAINYEQETADISRKAGVAAALCRVSETRIAMRWAAHQVYATPINTARGIQVKAEALKLTNPEVFTFTELGGIGPLIRIAQDAIELNEVSA